MQRQSIDAHGDVFRWPNTLDGRITVKSAYHAIKGRHAGEAPAVDQQMAPLFPQLWSAIWKALVWPKVQAFLWKLVTNSLATKGVQQMELDRWLDSFVPAATSNRRRTSSATQGNDKLRWTTIMLACWFIWKALCQLVFNSKRLNHYFILQKIHAAHAELAVALSRRPLTIDQVQQRSWEAPRQGSIKVNCDASWCASSRRGGLGVIARDEIGHIRGGRNIQRTTSSIKELESLAIMKGVKLALEQRWQHVVIESDAELVVNHLNGVGFLWKLHTIVENTKVLASSIDSISWEFIPRSANHCVDWVAKQAMQGTILLDWDERPPAPLVSLLKSDFSLYPYSIRISSE